MPGRILIAEDEADVCDVLKEVLEHGQYEVDVIHNGDQAIRQIRSSSYDLLIVDIRLGGRTSGLDVLKSCKFLSGRPKIFVISALPKQDLKTLIVENGVVEIVEKILEKPDDVKPDILLKYVNRILNP